MTDKLSAGSETQLANEAIEFEWSGSKLEPGIAMALSGGGFRAMLFHAGAFVRLNELGLLEKMERISSVSGGSIAAGYLGLSWSKLGNADVDGVFPNFKALIADPLLAFSRRKIDIVDALTGLLPWTSAAEQVAETYEEHLFGDATLQALPDKPRFVFCATNLQTGVLWRFSKPYAGDYVVGRLDNPNIALARAVAASSAFPPVLSPLILEMPTNSFANWQTGPSIPAKDLASLRSRIVLTDGGVYDNHGIEPVLKRYRTIFVSDGGAPFARMAPLETDWISQLKRIVDVTDNQVRALRRRDLIARFTEGNKAPTQEAIAGDYPRKGAYWGIDTDPGKLSPAKPVKCDVSVTRMLARVATRLSDLGEQTSKQLINWGYSICDRSVRVNYTGTVNTKIDPHLPYPDASIG
ncbi:patatin-like phospholipase family protein [Bradyrhizobium yuanmingense]|uniref:patatin-like phospholipase family protein n=1 Tax=Bradyrhizobium yuanmingense TaxID=108015 RepID=UPI0012F9659E|nr:patatin-like phospholipase family protein [Bradyrhizobium yuanmingense]MVT55287.1 patatin-like phospholipase family protein [Bradyrhizobium yuanmingense]